MLDKCADGWGKKETDHYYRVTWKQGTYPSFPKKKDVAVGHVRKMIRHLGIDLACAKKHLGVLQ